MEGDTMTRKTWGVVLIVAGLILGIASALADVLRIGALPDTFGVGQIGGLIVGAAAVIVGLYLLLGEGQPEAPGAMAGTAPAEPAPIEPERAAAPDDLTRIEGIGPRLQGILYEAGITTFAEMAAQPPEQLTEIVKSAGFAAPFDATSWPRQAELAANGEWDVLAALQDDLTGGRRLG
jgi:predicted flap endonuclease-1-like 5' DNA nuclease